jgi:hypothetical protein
MKEDAETPEMTDSLNVRSAREVMKALASRLAERMFPDAQSKSVDSESLGHDLSEALYDLVMSSGLNRGDVFALFAVLAKVAGVAEPAISGPYLGTQRILNDEFIFEAFTPRGSAAFRHRTTNRTLYLAIEAGRLLIGMYEPDIDNLAAFVNPDDALAWVRGGRMEQRIINRLWFLP